MKNYDQEFRKVTVKKYLDGQSVASIAGVIGVNENTIHKWKKDLLSVNGEVDTEKLSMRKGFLNSNSRKRNHKKAATIFSRSG